MGFLLDNEVVLYLCYLDTEVMILARLDCMAKVLPKTIFLYSVCAPDALEALLGGFSPKVAFSSFILLSVININ